jgi:hypothetical protein
MHTITYKGKKYHRDPKSKRRQHRVYYWRHDKWKEAPFPLHRQIWIDKNGPIPKGYIVHHKDDNPLNNSIGNLQLMTASEYSTYHIKERLENRKIDCEQCETTFTYKSIAKAKYCSKKCQYKSKWAREKERNSKKKKKIHY